jgi:hypothetical protein
MAETAYIVIGVVVVIAIAIAIIAATTQRRTARLHRTFGPEYDRTVASTGDRRSAEKDLAGRVARRGQLTIVPLSDAARQQYATAWQQIQSDFVDAPAQSVQAADVLVARVMSDRGYPMTEFDQRAADISVDHPGVVENYRLAHATCIGTAQGSTTTEDLRRAMTQYRALFNELLSTSDAVTQQQTQAPAPAEAYSTAGVGGTATAPSAAPGPPQA